MNKFLRGALSLLLICIVVSTIDAHFQHEKADIQELNLPPPPDECILIGQYCIPIQSVFHTHTGTINGIVMK